MDPLAQTTKKRIDKILDILKTDLSTIRTGRANPAVVESVVISVYGGSTKLKVMELATIGVSDSQTIVLTPFDPSIIHEIEKGIQEANVGLNPVVDGHLLRISIPPLSQERRQELIKAMKHKLENGRIMIRQARHEAMEDIKKEFDGREDDIKRLEKEVQKLVDDTIETIEDWGRQKEQELLQI
jgi:ribosome recycling factor